MRSLWNALITSLMPLLIAGIYAYASGYFTAQISVIPNPSATSLSGSDIERINSYLSKKSKYDTTLLKVSNFIISNDGYGEIKNPEIRFRESYSRLDKAKVVIYGFSSDPTSDNGVDDDTSLKAGKDFISLKYKSLKPGDKQNVWIVTDGVYGDLNAVSRTHDVYRLAVYEGFFDPMTVLIVACVLFGVGFMFGAIAINTGFDSLLKSRNIDTTKFLEKDKSLPEILNNADKTHVEITKWIMSRHTGGINGK